MPGVPVRLAVVVAFLSTMLVAQNAPALPLQTTQLKGQGTAGGIWLDVPFVAQEKEGCGAAAVAMVMEYWRGKTETIPEADPVQIQRALYSKDAHGIYASAMQRYLEERSFRTFAFRGAWDDLKQHLEKGRPLIVALRPAATSALHYVVVTGIDWEHGLVLVNDPAQKKLLKQDRTSFEREWNAAQKWTLLAVPQSGAH